MKDPAARDQLLPSLLFCFVEIVSSRLAPSRITNFVENGAEFEADMFCAMNERF